jgi:hypothetical protein
MRFLVSRSRFCHGLNLLNSRLVTDNALYLGSAGPRFIRLKSLPCWTKAETRTIHEDGSGVTTTIKERFKLQFLSMNDDCSLGQVCTESRQVVIKRSPLFLPSATVNKEIRFDLSDVLVIKDTSRLVGDLIDANEKGLEIPKPLSHIHTLAVFVFGRVSPGWCKNYFHKLINIIQLVPYCTNLRSMCLCFHKDIENNSYDSLTDFTSDLSIIGRSDEDKNLEHAMALLGDLVEQIQDEVRVGTYGVGLQALEVNYMVPLSKA